MQAVGNRILDSNRLFGRSAEAVRFLEVADGKEVTSLLWQAPERPEMMSGL